MERRSEVRSRTLSGVRIRMTDGRFHFLGLGAWHSFWRYPYYLMLTVPWQGFFLITIGLYAIANALFAALLLLGGKDTIR
jgi:inward rectifier potassium channel